MRETQAQRVLKGLSRGKWLSGLDFYYWFTPAILCYTKRFSEIRRMGYKIEKRWNHKGYWEYRLGGKA